MLHTRGRPAGLQLDSAASGPAGAGPGLTNNTGEYNCFLNAIIQCVWRCEDFRKGMLDMDVSGIPRHVEGNRASLPLSIVSPSSFAAEGARSVTACGA